MTPIPQNLRPNLEQVQTLVGLRLLLSLRDYLPNLSRADTVVVQGIFEMLC